MVMQAQAPANSATRWQSILDTVQVLGLDYLRRRYSDVETPADDRNIPDQADLRYGTGSAMTEPAAGGWPAWAWLAIGAAGVAVLFALRK